MRSALVFILMFMVSALFAGAEADEEFSDRGYLYEITFSKYSADNEEKRDDAFGEWFDREASQREFEIMSQDGKYPVITELTSQHYKRRIFAKRKASFAVRSGRSYRHFAEYHKEYFTKGFQLLSLTRFVDQFGKKWYSATWVNHKDYEEFAKDLELYGITRAQVIMREE